MYEFPRYPGDDEFGDEDEDEEEDMLKSSGIVSPTTFSNGGLRRLSNSPGPTEVAMDSVRGSDGQESLKHSEDDEDVPVGAPVHNIANRTLISSGVVIAVLILGW